MVSLDDSFGASDALEVTVGVIVRAGKLVSLEDPVGVGDSVWDREKAADVVTLGECDGVAVNEGDADALAESERDALVEDDADALAEDDGIGLESRYAPAGTTRAPKGFDKWSMPKPSAPPACAKAPKPSAALPEK